MNNRQPKSLKRITTILDKLRSHDKYDRYSYAVIYKKKKKEGN